MNDITKKQLDDLQRQTQPDILAPKIIDATFKQRISASAYASTGGARLWQPDTMLEFEWQGKRYVIPAYIKR